MTFLAKLGSVVLILLGLVFVYHDVATAISQSLPNWLYLINEMKLWRWGLAAIAAGALCAALITIAEAMAMKAASPASAASAPSVQATKPT